jgi:pimeloyl-ACP methyl ester carboxylesterase
MWAFKLFYRVFAPFYSRDRTWAEMMDRDVSKLTLESFLMSIASLRRTDLRPFLNQIKIPAMGMFGDRDIVVHPAQWKPMLEGISHARIERFHHAGHFIMLDEPQRFMETLRDFLDTAPPSVSGFPAPAGVPAAPDSAAPLPQPNPAPPAGNLAPPTTL